MTALYDADGTPLRRERDGDLVPVRDPARPCTPAETRIHANQVRALLRGNNNERGTHADH